MSPYSLHPSPSLINTLSWVVLLLLWNFPCFSSVSSQFPPVHTCLPVDCVKTYLHGNLKAEYWQWGGKRTGQQQLLGKKKERLNSGRINQGSLALELKDNRRAPVPQNKNNMANRTYASPYYNLFCRYTILFLSSPTSSVIVFLYVCCLEMCLHLCLENI